MLQCIITWLKKKEQESGYILIRLLQESGSYLKCMTFYNTELWGHRLKRLGNYIWFWGIEQGIVSVHFYDVYQIFPDAGSRDPQPWAPVCKSGWGWVFCHGASSCFQLPLREEIAGGPPGAETGYRQGQWCNPQTLHPVKQMGDKRTCTDCCRVIKWDAAI